MRRGGVLGVMLVSLAAVLALAAVAGAGAQGGGTTAAVEVRVWQHLEDLEDIRISARPAGGDWGVLGTIRILLDDGFSSSGTFQFGDISLDVPLPPEEVSTLAGRAGVFGFEDGVGAAVEFGGLFGQGFPGLAVDRHGAVFVADRENDAVRRIAPDGTVTTVAGGSSGGLLDGPGAEARFDSPSDVVVDGGGTIYVADTNNHRIRQISPDGVVTTVAGSDHGEGGRLEVRDGPALEARFQYPRALALDRFGDLYILEQRHRVRRLSPSGTVSTVAGGIGWGLRDGPGPEAIFRHLIDLAVDDSGNLYVLDDTRGTVGPGGAASAIRKIDPSGNVTTLYTDRPPGVGGTLAYPTGIVVTGDGTLYLANSGRHQIVRLTVGGELLAVAGTGEKGSFDGSRGSAVFSLPASMALSPDGALIVADQSGSVLRRVTLARSGEEEAIPLASHDPLPHMPGVLVEVFGSMGDVDQGALFSVPEGMALDGSGNLIVAGRATNAIHAIAPDGTVSTLAGTGEAGSRDGPCDTAQFNAPTAVAVDAVGAIYVAEFGTSAIRRITRDCVVTTVAGGEDGYRDGPASRALFLRPRAIAFDGEGGLLIADTENALIRRLGPDGQVTTIAGNPAQAGVGNPRSRDGRAELARFAHPTGLAVDSEGNVFFTDSNEAIRKMDNSGFVSTVLRTPDYFEGGALSGFFGDLAAGPDGELYIADSGYSRILRLAPDGELAVVADLGHGLRSPSGLLLAPDGTLYVSDWNANAIFRITFEEGDE